MRDYTIEGTSMQTLQTLKSRAIGTAAAAAIALTALNQPAAAHSRYINNVGAAAAAIAIFGTVAAIIAASQHRHAYHRVGPVYRGPIREPRGWYRHGFHRR
jgi:cobalamin synthase